MYDILSVSRGGRKDRVERKFIIEAYQLTLVIGSYDTIQLKAKFEGNAGRESHNGEVWLSLF